MLEDIALSISTLFFVVCNMIINSFAPAVPADQNNPTPPLETTAIHNAVICNAAESEIDGFAIVGVWESFGCTYEFTSSGKLIIDDETLRYSIEGDTVTVSGNNAETRTMKLETLGNRAMRLNGITLYKIN